MAYPLINGTAINGDEGGGGTTGIDLALHQPPSTARSAMGQGAYPFGFGTAAIRLTISPPGLDLARAEQHVIKFNRNLIPAGMDLANSAPPLLAMRIMDPGHSPLDFGIGKVQIGHDVALAAVGIDLARAGQSALARGLPPPNTAIQASGRRALELGNAAVQSGAVTVYAPSAWPLELGVGSVKVALQAPAGDSLSLGASGATVLLRAPGAHALELGAPAAQSGLSLSGIELCTAGASRILPQGVALLAAGYQPIELGAPMELPVMVRARQSFPFALGQPGVYRGTTC